MTAKEYLQQLKRLDIAINQKTRELDDLRSKSRIVKGIDYSKDRVQTSSSGDAPFVKLIERIADLEKEIDTEINEFVDEKHKIINQIQSLKNANHSRLLYERYVEYKSLEQICDDMKFSHAYIKHMHGDALQNFEKFLNSTPNNT